MLPYSDTKPVGAADFYFAINATFQFIRRSLGAAALEEYWSDLGGGYFRPVSEIWRRGGLVAVAEYWRDFFAAEPGGDVEVSGSGARVTVSVRRCPAIAHLRAGKREIDPGFCRHCYFVSQAIGEPAGISVRIEGGDGACRQEFIAGTECEPQVLSAIKECL